jgi:hypothetical protein
MRQRSILLCLFLLLPVAARAQSLPQIRGLDAGPLIAAVRQACEAQGGDPERQFYHFVFAFSTSHFGSDAGHGEAMRQAAAEVARDLLVPGDSYSVAAWEMEVWDLQGPFEVQRMDRESRGRVAQRSFPRTHQAGTTGGHDTEQTIVNLIDRVGLAGPEQALGTVLLLFTSSEASMNSADRRAIGGNNRAYQAAMGRWVRRPAVRLNFEAERTGGRGDWVPRRMDVVVVVPRQISGTAITRGTRSDLAEGGVGAGAPGGAAPGGGDAAPRRGSGVPWAAIIPALLMAALVAVWLLRRRTGGALVGSSGMKTLAVGDRRFVLEEASDGETWRLVGPRFPGPGPRDASVGEAGEGVPPVVLGQITYRKGQLLLEALGDQTTLVRNGTEEGSRFPLPPGRHDVLIRGQHLADPALPPSHFQVRVPIEIE